MGLRSSFPCNASSCFQPQVLLLFIQYLSVLIHRLSVFLPDQLAHSGLYLPHDKLKDKFFLGTFCWLLLFHFKFFYFLEIYSPFTLYWWSSSHVLLHQKFIPLCAFYYHFRGIRTELKKARLFSLPFFTDSSEAQKLTFSVAVSRKWASLWKLDMKVQ